MILVYFVKVLLCVCVCLYESCKDFRVHALKFECNTAIFDLILVNFAMHSLFANHLVDTNKTEAILAQHKDIYTEALINNHYLIWRSPKALSSWKVALSHGKVVYGGDNLEGLPSLKGSSPEGQTMYGGANPEAPLLREVAPSQGLTVTANPTRPMLKKCICGNGESSCADTPTTLFL
ncbi:hypothetical protein L1887_36446 [Cichorium endivia]|nr:hypothetical protein L1887_36446 [Cichorium endivia]